MNAGCFGNETWEFVKSVEVMDRNGEIHQLDPEEFSISYRSVGFPFPLWFLSCVMSFPEEGFTTIEELKRESFPEFLQTAPWLKPHDPSRSRHRL